MLRREPGQGRTRDSGMAPHGGVRAWNRFTANVLGGGLLLAAAAMFRWYLAIWRAAEAEAQTKDSPIRPSSASTGSNSAGGCR